MINDQPAKSEYQNRHVTSTRQSKHVAAQRWYAQMRASSIDAVPLSEIHFVNNWAALRKYSDKRSFTFIKKYDSESSIKTKTLSYLENVLF